MFSWLLYLIVVCEVSIVQTYILLCYENYHWWWPSFISGASPALYFFALSLMHIVISGAPNMVATLLETIAVTLSLGLMSGSIAVLVSFKFN